MGRCAGRVERPPLPTRQPFLGATGHHFVGITGWPAPGDPHGSPLKKSAPPSHQSRGTSLSGLRCVPRSGPRPRPSSSGPALLAQRAASRAVPIVAVPPLHPTKVPRQKNQDPLHQARRATFWLWSRRSAAHTSFESASCSSRLSFAFSSRSACSMRAMCCPPTPSVVASQWPRIDAALEVSSR